MSVGLGLLFCLLSNRRPVSVLGEAGVSRDSFTGDEQRVYDFLVQHVERYGTIPQVETVEVESGVRFPEFPSEPLGYWIDAVDRRAQVTSISRAITRAQDLVSDGDIAEAKAVLRDLHLDLTMRSPADRTMVLSDLASAVVQAHDRLQRSTTLSGIPFGLPYLDAISNGAQPTDTVALVGRPGTGKSYFLLRMALNAYDGGHVPLVLTLEMSALQCARRAIALRTGVPATMIRLGRLSFWGRERLVSDVGRLQDLGGQPFYLMQGSLKTTVEDLVLKVRELRPSALYVDGAYLLRTRSKNASHWERIAETAEYLKMMATEFSIPTLATYQFNRRGPGSLGNIAHSDVVGQLASIVIGIDEEDEEDARTFSSRQYKILELLKGREGERGTIRMVYDMNRMQISQESVIRGYVAREDQED